MTVIVKYFIVRNGIEFDQAFCDKKEAEAYDKMLDAADELESFIRNSGIEIDMDDNTIREIAVVLAKNGPQVTQILKNIKPYTPTERASEPPGDASDTGHDPDKTKTQSERSKRKSK